MPAEEIYFDIRQRQTVCSPRKHDKDGEIRFASTWIYMDILLRRGIVNPPECGESLKVYLTHTHTEIVVHRKVTTQTQLFSFKDRYRMVQEKRKPNKQDASDELRIRTSYISYRYFIFPPVKLRY